MVIVNNIDVVLVYFLYRFSSNFNIVIYHIIRDHGNNESTVDKIAGHDTRY